MEAVIVTERLLDLFTQRRVFHATWRGRRWAVGERLLLYRQARLEPYASLFAGHVLPLRM